MQTYFSTHRTRQRAKRNHQKIIMLVAGTLLAMSLHAQNATALLARHRELAEVLANNQFKRPLYMESREDKGRLQGDVYAVLARPYAQAGPALQGMREWCDILMLHPNVKGCQTVHASGPLLKVSIGRKSEQDLKDTHLFEFQFAVGVKQSNYSQTLLSATEGPLGTSQYRIMLEVTPLDAQHSFLHLAYSYSAGTAANLALRGYLATLGHDKVGFTITGHEADGTPQYIRGKRGVVERNTLRYYLAIEAYLGSLSVAPSQQLSKRLNDWFDSSERHPLQLHELERNEYLNMKQREFARQGSTAPVT